MGVAFTERSIFIQTFIYLILITSTSSSPTKLPNPNDKKSAYDVLQDYNFPIGILPKGVMDYTLETSTGKFSASFNGSCSFALEGSYQLKYKSSIKGHISKGKLANLEGVSVKLLWMWVDIVEVSRSGDDLQFSVGIAAAGFPVDNFEECPQCGCGLNCDGKVRKLRKNSFISSS